MALVLADRVQQTATANTTVSFTLSGSVSGFQSFSVIGNTNTTYYAATDASGSWEVGIGTYSTTGPTLTRTTILSSSNAGSAVTFVGTVNVFVTYPSSKSVEYEQTGGVIITDNSSNNALRITQTGAGNALVVEDSANPDTTPFVINSAGDVISGYTATIATQNYGGSPVTPKLQLQGASQDTTSISSFNWGTSTGSPANLILNKSIGGTIGTRGGLSVYGTDIGSITFNSDDGTNFVPSASILAEFDTVSQTGSGMPGRLVFSTTDPFGITPTERMRISSSGEVTIGGTTPFLDSSGALVVGQTNTTPILGLFRSDTSIVTNDILGSLSFYGNDTTGNNAIPLALISAVASGTHAAGDNPTDLVFSTTPDNTSAYVTALKITQAGDLQFNSGFGSVATAYGCRAWVSFDGTASGAFPGGTSTVTRVAGSSTATVTTTTAHGLIVGSTVQALTGVVAGTYVVTGSTSTTTFTFTTAATTALTNVSITFAVNSIYADGNVSSVADIAVGRYAVNFVTAFPDANYVMAGSSGNLSGVTTAARSVARDGAWTTGSALIRNMSSSGTASDDTYIGVAFFR